MALYTGLVALVWRGVNRFKTYLGGRSKELGDYMKVGQKGIWR